MLKVLHNTKGLKQAKLKVLQHKKLKQANLKVLYNTKGLKQAKLKVLHKHKKVEKGEFESPTHS